MLPALLMAFSSEVSLVIQDGVEFLGGLNFSPSAVLSKKFGFFHIETHSS